MVTTEVFIDPNVRVRGGQTYSAFSDVRGDLPDVGEEVFVREPESNLVGKAVVADIDHQDHLIYLRVDWATLAPEVPLTPDQFMAQVVAATSASPIVLQPFVQDHHGSFGSGSWRQWRA